MGYRSDVKIVVSMEGFRELKEYAIKESIQFRKPDNNYSYNLLEYADNIKTDGDQVVISWDSIKWYEGDYPDVDIIMHGLDHLAAKGYSYRYYRIGESYDDIEETYIDGDLDQDLDYLYIVRYIDDDIIKGKNMKYGDFDNLNMKGSE